MTLEDILTYLLVIYILLSILDIEIPKRDTRPLGRKPTEKILTPYEKERLAESLYTTAREYEIAYYLRTKARRDALIAIDNFKECYTLSPNGVNAALALIRMSKLYYRIGYVEDARRTLRTLEARVALALLYGEEIDDLRSLIYGHQ
ncbi:hypothetical protein ACFL4U_03820 [Candidatus Neomarinimicrobiota bacterium]